MDYRKMNISSQNSPHEIKSLREPTGMSSEEAPQCSCPLRVPNHVQALCSRCFTISTNTDSLASETVDLRRNFIPDEEMMTKEMSQIEGSIFHIIPLFI